jgi:hypothetical protein
MSQTYRRRRRIGLALGLIPAVAVAAVVTDVRSAPFGASACRQVTVGVTRYCGPATARLSVFPGVVFERGTCTWKTVDHVRLLQVRIGARTLDGNPKNGGRALFSLGLAGSPSRPGAGSVIAYYRGQRWSGRAAAFTEDRRGATFVADGVGSSSGRATGRVRC